MKKGTQAVAEMLALMTPEEREKLLSNVAAQDPRAAARIREEMFCFEDLTQLEDESLRVLLGEIDRADLLLALRRSPDELKEAVFKSMTKRSATELVEDLASSPPRKLIDVQQAQKRISEHARTLEQQGRLARKRK